MSIEGQGRGTKGSIQWPPSVTPTQSAWLGEGPAEQQCLGRNFKCDEREENGARRRLQENGASSRTSLNLLSLPSRPKHNLALGLINHLADFDGRGAWGSPRACCLSQGAKSPKRSGTRGDPGRSTSHEAQRAASRSWLLASAPCPALDAFISLK